MVTAAGVLGRFEVRLSQLAAATPMSASGTWTRIVLGQEWALFSIRVPKSAEILDIVQRARKICRKILLDVFQ